MFVGVHFSVSESDGDVEGSDGSGNDVNDGDTDNVNDDDNDEVNDDDNEGDNDSDEGIFKPQHQH